MTRKYYYAISATLAVTLNSCGMHLLFETASVSSIVAVVGSVFWLFFLILELAEE